MKRKNIAVCVTGYNWDYESRIVSAVWDECARLDINLLIFAPLIHRPSLNMDRVLPESVIRGEKEIFNLMNYDIIDGIVIMGESMADERTVFEIAAKAAENNVPIVNVCDPVHTLQRNVLLNDQNGMEDVVRHLVEVHGFTKINFIGGFKGNIQTEERLAAYKKVLGEHNIPVEESRIAYGEFWKKSIECTEQFIASGDIPQAIVCANDTMAIFCIDCLQNMGYRVPEDIVVTGFDATPDIEKHKPTITSVRQGLTAAGHKAVEILTDIWAGKPTEVVSEVYSELVLMESCGCVHKAEKKVSDYFTETYGAETDAMEFHTYIHDMNTDFASVKNQTELFASANHSARFFKLKKLFICICSNIYKESAQLDKDDLISSFRGISDEMVNMFSYGSDVPVGKSFPTAQLVAEEILNGEKPVVFAFSPLYFKDSFLGYLAYEPSCFKGYGKHFETWLLALSNNSGSFYMNRKLELVVEQLENLYVRDPLTGLYNRRGMAKYSAELMQKAKSKGLCITAVCSDIDNLKPINDLYGHEAGDNAIVRTARAIADSMPCGAVCVRTGGDEFCSLLISESDEETSGIIKRIEAALDQYNSTSGLPYKIGCSSGFCSMKAEETDSIEKIAALADEQMYMVKTRKKAMRKI
ncbi:MAG: diguanylate cyclase domain-containing protein [Ruminiclostridium sp.]